MTNERRRAQIALRLALLGLVVAWMFSSSLRARLPYWVPLVALVAIEGEFLLRGIRERRAAGGSSPRVRQGPGREDADLGWGELVEDEHGLRWAPPPTRAPRGRTDALVGAAMAVAVAAAILVGLRGDRDAAWRSLSSAARAETEARLTREAAGIAGRPVTVRCDDGYAFTGARSDALGVAFPSQRLAFLEPAICRALHDVVGGDHEESDRNGEAIVVLAHEAVHLRGERNEGVTECYALQEGVGLGARLGVPVDRIERMMRTRYRQALAERGLTRLAYALPRECVSGGALDLSPGDSRFP